MNPAPWVRFLQTYIVLALCNKVNVLYSSYIAYTITFLHPFHTATVQLSRDHVPTSPDVWPMLLRLKSLCKATENDSDSMGNLKTAFSISLDEKYIIHTLHKLATLVSPAFKYLTFVDTAERDEMYAQMRAKVDSLPSLEEPDVSKAEPCAKKQKLEHEDLLLDYRTAVSVPEAGDER